MRQLTDATGAVTFAQSYDPYGVVSMTSGTASSRYGYTGEQQDASGRVYLRARYYNPNVGRFLTRDTWNGDANRPMSYNRWMYAYGNPVNLSDPTGMNPADQGYCESIAGSSSYIQCEKIVRGLNPRDTTINLAIYDATNSTSDCPLYESLDLPGTKLNDKMPSKKSEDYGFWFHYMLDQRSGWVGGRTHVSFLAVATMSLANELGHDSLRSQIMELAAQAFVRKGWSGPGGFYAMIGSREVVRNAVDDALFYERLPTEKQSCTRLWDRNKGTKYCPTPGDRSFEQALDAFFTGKRGIWQFDMRGGLAGVMDAALNNPSFHNNGGGNAPYEWGNATKYTEQYKEALWDKLKAPWDSSSPPNTDPLGVYYRTDPSLNYYGQYFVLTEKQFGNLCGGSCVAP